jgi:hypothetical protein
VVAGSIPAASSYFGIVFMVVEIFDEFSGTTRFNYDANRLK